MNDQAPARPFVRVTDFLKALHDAGLLPQYPALSRVVIDADITKGAVAMYVDQIPSGALLQVPALMAAGVEPAGPDMYVSHEHGYPGGGHSHAVGQRHPGDVNNPRANDHTGIGVITWAEHIDRYRSRAQ